MKSQTKKMKTYIYNPLNKTTLIPPLPTLNQKLLGWSPCSEPCNILWDLPTMYYGLLKLIPLNENFPFLNSVIVSCLNTIVLIHNPWFSVLNTIMYWNFLTLPGLDFFQNLRAGGERYLVGLQWKNMLYLRNYLSILHKILYIYCIDNME